MTTQLQLKAQPNTPVDGSQLSFNRLPLYLSLIPLLLLGYQNLFVIYVIINPSNDIINLIYDIINSIHIIINLNLGHDEWNFFLVIFNAILPWHGNAVVSHAVQAMQSCRRCSLKLPHALFAQHDSSFGR